MSIDNRMYLLTPPGAAAIAVVRLVGSGVDEFLCEHFSRAVPVDRCVHGTLSDGDFVIDDPVIVRSAANTMDVNLHGGPWVVRSAMNLAVASGFSEVASTLPLPVDAVDAPSEIWREVLEYLPLAITEQATRMLLAQPVAWDRLLDRNDAEEMRRVLADRSGHWLLHPPTVAIIGPPNVGKSTLANQLFAQERSITADLPGTTRDWVGEIVTLDGLAVMLLDTPGVRSTDDPIERAAILASGEQVRAADLVVIVFDLSTELGEVEMAMIEAHRDAVVVGNKSDVAREESGSSEYLRHRLGGFRQLQQKELASKRSGRRFASASIASRWILIGRDVWTDRQRDLLMSKTHNAR